MPRHIFRLLTGGVCLLALLSCTAMAFASPNSQPPTDEQASPWHSSSAGTGLLLSMMIASNQHLASQTQFLATLAAQERRANAQLQSVRRASNQLARQADRDRQVAIPWLRALYESGGNDVGAILSLLLHAGSFARLQSDLGYLDVLLAMQNRALQQLQTDQNRLNQVNAARESVVQDLQITAANVKAEQFLYQQARNASPHTSEASVMMTLQKRLQSDWTHSIAPNMTSTLTALDAAMNHLPGAISTSDVHLTADGARVTLSQQELNHILWRENPSLRTMRFLFRKDTWIVFAQSGAHTVLLLGDTRMSADHQQVNFRVTHAAVDGILLPADQIHQWLAPYTFTLQLSNIRAGLSVQSVSLTDQSISVDARFHVF